jgi:hypothetical protein
MALELGVTIIGRIDVRTTQGGVCVRTLLVRIFWYHHSQAPLAELKPQVRGWDILLRQSSYALESKDADIDSDSPNVPHQPRRVAPLAGCVGSASFQREGAKRHTGHSNRRRNRSVSRSAFFDPSQDGEHQSVERERKQQLQDCEGDDELTAL